VIGLDTNVLVRYLTQDDAAQAEKADAIIGSAVARGQRCVIDLVVLCELVWVLRDAYDTTKSEIVTTLDRMLATQQFEITDKDRIREALDAYRSGRADFADYVIGAANRYAGCAETVTFDRQLRGAPGFRVL
jgi:predicted nucleic-acid-binding protein